MMPTLARETEDEVHGGPWDHYRLSGDEGVVDFVADEGGWLIEVRGDPGLYPDFFTLAPRPAEEARRPARYVLAEGVSLPA